MATDFHTLGMLLLASGDHPVFSSTEQIFEYHDAFLYQKSDESYIDYVLSGSRKNWLMYVLKELCIRAGVDNLGFLYGSETAKYEFAFEESIEGFGTWCVWNCSIIKSNQLGQAITAISALFDWSRNHISELNEYYTNSCCSEEDLKYAINQPVTTKEPTLDDRVWYSDDGDGPWCLYSYLCSMQQLMRNAFEKNVTLFYMVQVPK